MSVADIVLLIAAIVALGAVAQPLAERLRLPVSIIYALTGLLLALVGPQAGDEIGAAGEAGVLARLPLDLDSDLFLHAFLPILLFHGALSVDIHRMREDVAAILILALLAVAVAIFGIAFALWPFVSLPLGACLLLAAVVATTDPVAVIAIFRSVGAPERLTRLMEGESLFNDAAAVAFFLAFVGMVTHAGAPDLSRFAVDLVWAPAGGAAVGAVFAALLLQLPRTLLEDRVSVASLSLALPFMTFSAAEALHLSGILGVVAAGVTLGTLAPGRVTPVAWRYVGDVWELLAQSATVLVFVLTALLVPRLMAGWTVGDVALLAVLFVAALAARAVILFGLFPLLSRAGSMPDLPASYRSVALLGGLRGSMTLVLALAVTENAAIPEDMRVFVATLATAFTLVTLFVQGPMLRPLIQWLGLDRLSGVDLALRDLAATATRLRGAGDSPEATGPERPRDALSFEGRLATGLAAVTAREREVVLERFEGGVVSARVARRLLAESRRRLDLSRLGGADGYGRADASEIAFAPSDRAAVWLQRQVGASGPLAHRLALRFETLIEASMVIAALGPFVEGDLGRILGGDVAAEIARLIEARAFGVEREVAALRLQYPGYFTELEALMNARAAQSEEARDVARMRRTGVIGAEVERDLLDDLRRRDRALRRAPNLDLGLDTRALIDACPIFDALGDAEKHDLARQMRPFFTAPGDRIISRGEHGTEAFFISSGAVEVSTGNSVLRLGRGDVIGEMALLFDQRRQADVTVIAYSVLLRLRAADFDRFLGRSPALREAVMRIGEARRAQNVAAQAPSATI